MNATGAARRAIGLTSATVLVIATTVVTADTAIATVTACMISVLKVRIARSTWGIPSLTAASAPPSSITDRLLEMLTRG